MVRRKLKCFIAMAFGKNDVDALYKKKVKPCLAKLNITAFRVDKKEHNRNINEVIMEELQKADFVIADLTYARPSVYFEAGYAECRVPVIYTARSDHFSRTKEDEHGNFAVHFDVSMRNIIKWSSVDDKSFEKRLEKRIRLVTKPLFKDYEEKLQQQNEVKKYKRKPATEQLLLLYRLSGQIIKEHDFRILYTSKDSGVYKVSKVKGMQMIVMYFEILYRVPHPTKTYQPWFMRYKMLPMVTKSLEIQAKRRSIKQVDTHHISIIHGKINLSRMKKEIPMAAVGNNYNELIISAAVTHNELRSQSVQRMRKKTAESKIPLDMHIHFLDNIQSESDFKEKLSQIMESL